MKLVGLLKGKVEKAETMEEKKELIKEAGVELNDDELEGVAGGLKRRFPSDNQKDFLAGCVRDMALKQKK